MKLKFRKKTDTRTKARLKNKVRIRKKLAGTAERPRFSVFRSGRHIYAQLIDDVSGKTIVASSTLKLSLEAGKASKGGAQAVGAEIAKKAIEKKIKNVVFDRSGYVYHGRIKALADGAREAGLNF